MKDHYKHRAQRYANDMEEEYKNMFAAFIRLASYDSKIDKMLVKSKENNESQDNISDILDQRELYRKRVLAFVPKMLCVLEEWDPDLLARDVDKDVHDIIQTWCDACYDSELIFQQDDGSYSTFED